MFNPVIGLTWKQPKEAPALDLARLRLEEENRPNFFYSQSFGIGRRSFEPSHTHIFVPREHHKQTQSFGLLIRKIGQSCPSFVFSCYSLSQAISRFKIRRHRQHRRAYACLVQPLTIELYNSQPIGL